MRPFLLVLILLLSVISTYAGSIEGVVLDNNTGEPLPGVLLYIKGRETAATYADLNGRFFLNRAPVGSLSLVCSSISYQPITQWIEVHANDTVKVELRMHPVEHVLSTITMHGSYLTTDASVRKMEKLAPGIINLVSAKTIELSPDLSVADVLGRVSGVIMDRSSSGQAEYVVLRGMDKRYNITTVNGVKISSPNNKQRFVPLNIFPSELLGRLEVTKTRTAEIEGDATGGMVDLVMKDAPQTFTLHANLSSGYSSLFFNEPFYTYDKSKTIQVAPYEQYGKDYISTIADFGSMIAPQQEKAKPHLFAGLTVGDRLFKNKLGVILAANYQYSDKGTKTTYFDDMVTQQDSVMRLTKVNNRYYTESQIQYGAHLKLDYTVNPRHKFEWYSFLTANQTHQVRLSTSTDFMLYYDPTVGNFDLSYQTRIRSTQQQIATTLIKGVHNLNDQLDLTWRALYSQATQEQPDEIHVNSDNLVDHFVDHIQLDGDGSQREWNHNSDKDVSAMVDAVYLLPLGDRLFNFQAGAMFRNKWRDNFMVQYTFKPNDLNQAYESIDEIEWTVKNPRGSVGPLTYQATERLTAAYLQAMHETGPLKFILGVRAEYTDQGYHMVYPMAGEPADGSQTYLDILPNVQLKYSPSDQTNWRFSYFGSINRPGFFEIVPYQIQEEEYTEYGNKKLKRATIQNVDARWEYFPTPIDVLMVGLFYKHINNPIEFSYASINQRQSGYMLQNLGIAQNVGVELDWVRFFGIWGIKGNYTYTHSSITTPKVYYGRNQSGNVTTLIQNQTRPLVGQSEHVGNLMLICKDLTHGWDAQVGLQYVGDRIVTTSRFMNSDYWEKGGLRLDASIEKTFKRGCSAFIKANNLFNTPTIYFVKTHNPVNDAFPLQSATGGETLIRKSTYGSTFLTGIRYHF